MSVTPNTHGMSGICVSTGRTPNNILPSTTVLRHSLLHTCNLHVPRDTTRPRFPRSTSAHHWKQITICFLNLQFNWFFVNCIFIFLPTFQVLFCGTFLEVTLVNTKFGYSIFSFQLDNLDQQELASRLTLNCVDDYVQPQMLRNIPVMIMDVGDFTRI